MSKSRIFILILAGFLAGIAAGGLLYFNLGIWFGLTIALVLVGIGFKKEKLILLLSIFFICALAGFGYYSYFIQRIQPQNLPFGQEAKFSGIVSAEPDVRQTNTKLTIKTFDFGRLTKILITAPKYPEYSYGDELKVSGKLEKPGKFEDFDYGAYLERYQIFGIINNLNKTQIEKIGQNKGDIIHRGLFYIKGKFEQSMNRILPEPEASFLAGLLLGERRNIPQNLLDAFNKTGTTHIIAISGYNVTIIISAIAILLAKRSKKMAFWVSLGIIILFTILTGAAASVVRASIIAGLVAFGKTIGRRANNTAVLLLAAVVMCLVNPMVLRFDIGFQLSFLAFAGLIYFGPMIHNLKILSKIPDIFRVPLGETLSAQAMVIPIILVYFGRFSLIAPLANILVLPVIPLAMLLGFIASTAGIIYTGLGQIFGWPAWLVLKYIIVVVEWLAKVPYASIEAKNVSGWWMLLYYLIIITIFIWYNRKYGKEKRIGNQ